MQSLSLDTGNNIPVEEERFSKVKHDRMSFSVISGEFICK